MTETGAICQIAREPACNECGQPYWNHRYAKCGACISRLIRVANGSATPADLAAHLGYTALKLAASLSEFEDDPSASAEWVQALGDAEHALDRALGLDVDELTLPARPVTHGIGRVVRSGVRPALVIDDEAAVSGDLSSGTRRSPAYVTLPDGRQVERTAECRCCDQLWRWSGIGDDGLCAACAVSTSAILSAGQRLADELAYVLEAHSNATRFHAALQAWRDLMAGRSEDAATIR